MLVKKLVELKWIVTNLSLFDILFQFLQYSVLKASSCGIWWSLLVNNVSDRSRAKQRRIGNLPCNHSICQAGNYDRCGISCVATCLPAVTSRSVSWSLLSLTADTRPSPPLLLPSFCLSCSLATSLVLHSLLTLTWRRSRSLVAFATLVDVCGCIILKLGTHVQTKG